MTLEGTPRDSEHDDRQDFPSTEAGLEIIPPTEAPEMNRIPPDIAEKIVLDITEQENRENEEESHRQHEIDEIKRRGSLN